jgi:hypothetical protein
MLDAAVADSSCVSLANPSKRQMQSIPLASMLNVKAYVSPSKYQLPVLINNKAQLKSNQK